MGGWLVGFFLASMVQARARRKKLEVCAHRPTLDTHSELRADFDAFQEDAAAKKAAFEAKRKAAAEVGSFCVLCNLLLSRLRCSEWLELGNNKFSCC